MIDIKKFREENKIKQKDICEILGIAQPYLSAIENGTRPLNEDKFKLLYKHYGDIVMQYQNKNVIITINDSQYGVNTVPLLPIAGHNINGNSNKVNSETDKFLDLLKTRDEQLTKSQQQIDRLLSIIESNSKK